MRCVEGNRTHPSCNKSERLILRAGRCPADPKPSLPAIGDRAPGHFLQTMAMDSNSIHVQSVTGGGYQDGVSGRDCTDAVLPCNLSIHLTRSLDCAAPPRSRTGRAAPLLDNANMTPREGRLHEARQAGGGPERVYPNVDEFPVSRANMFDRWRGACGLTILSPGVPGNLA